MWLKQNNNKTNFGALLADTVYGIINILYAIGIYVEHQCFVKAIYGI